MNSMKKASKLNVIFWYNFFKRLCDSICFCILEQSQIVKKFTTLLLILFLSSFYLISQNYVKNIGNPGIDDGATCIKIYENTLYLAGFSFKQCYLSAYDLQGNLLWKKYYEFSEDQNFISDFIIENKQIYAVGYGHNSGTDIFDEFFVNIDLVSHEVVWARKASISIKPNSIHFHEGLLYISGDEFAKGKFGICLLKLNPNKGKIEDLTTFYYSGHESASSSVIYKNVLYTGGRYGIKAKTDKYRAAISQFEVSNFEELKSNYFLNSKQDYARAYLIDLQVNEDTMVAACFSNNTGVDNHYTPSVINTLTNGSVNWAYEYLVQGAPSISIKDMLGLEDGYLLLGCAKSPLEDLLLIKIDKEGYPQYAYTIGGKYAENIILDQGSFLLEHKGQIFLAAQSKGLSEIGDYDAFLMSFNENDFFSDTCIASKKLDIVIKPYEDLIEGEIGLSQYDTIYKETNIAFNLPKSKTENDVFLCKTNQEQAEDAVENPFNNIAYNNTLFLLDASLSMNTEDRMPMLKASLYKLLSYMRLEDRISAVSFANNAELLLNGVSAKNIDEIKGKIDKLISTGQSDIIQGLEKSIKIAEENFSPELNNRIIITTDGDLSLATQKELKDLLLKAKSKNINFTIFLFNNSSLYLQQLQAIMLEVGGSIEVVNKNNIEEILLNELTAKKK